MTDWPRCPQCNELMCCDGKGNYECVSDHSLQQPETVSEEFPEFVLPQILTAVALGMKRLKLSGAGCACGNQVFEIRGNVCQCIVCHPNLDD